MQMPMKGPPALVVLLVVALAVAAGAEAQELGSRPPLSLETSAVQLSTSNRTSVWGGQLRVTVAVHERIDIVESATLLLLPVGTAVHNDLRLRFWGGPAGRWHPAYAAEVGYLVQSQDWLETAPEPGFVHGASIGGTWRFPLDVLRSGYVLAKWAYVMRADAPNMTIFNCSVSWNLSQSIGLRVGGDIHRGLQRLKYSGFIVGMSFSL